MNYVFYDFETSGLNFYFDQPIQLAAKLVDDQFNVIDEINEEKKKLKVMVKIFGRKNLLELSYMQVEKEI